MSHVQLGDVLDDSEDRPTHARGRGCLPALLALALIVGLGVFSYVKGVDLIKGALSSAPADYSGEGHGTVVIEVKQGQTATDIASTLAGAGIIESEQAFTDAATANPSSRSIQTGCYQLHMEMSGRSALTLMLDDSSHVNCPGQAQVTIPEGLRALEIVDRLATETDLSKSEVARTFAATTSLGLPSYADGDAEGYLFPATYDVSKKASASDVLTAMVDRFTAEAESLGLEAKAKQLGVSPHDVVVVASLVQAEASRPEDMPKVASVIYNRLDAGMALQLDSTLHYAVDSRGEVSTSKDLRNLASPYNTYTRTGLPPTAIDSPGEQAIAAALNPADTRYLYFVTVNLRTGETRFATTLSEHNRNVALLRHYCETSNAC